MSDSLLFKISVSAFIVRDHTILVLKRADDDAFLPGTWEVPGGGVDQDETVEEAVKRETLEEAGLHAAVGALFGYFEYLDGDGRRTINLNFLCRVHDAGQEATTSSGEMQEARWIGPEDIGSLPFTSQTMADACRKALSLATQSPKA